MVARRYDLPTQMRERSEQVARGGRGADARNFVDGIPKGVYFLAGVLAAELIPRKPRKGRR